MSFVRDLAVIAAGVSIPYALNWYRRRQLVRSAARAATEYRQSVDLAAAQASLDAHAERVMRALGAGLLNQPEVHTVPHRNPNPDAFLREAVRFAAQRFQVTLPEVEVRFVSWLPNAHGHAAEVTWDEPWDLIRTGDMFRVEWTATPRRGWQIIVGEVYRYDDELLLYLTAHEVAHVVLAALSADLADGVENERLTDTAVALAGLAPIMHRRAYLETWHESDRRIQYCIRQHGYLHQAEIEYVAGLRRRFASRPGAEAPITRTQN